MQQTSAVQWLVRCAFGAIALLLACRLAMVWIGTSLQQPAVTTRDGSLITFNRYVREPAPDLVLVGSSATWRLKEEYFSRSGVRNLAIAGGSPVTGLQIIARQQRLPRVVLIETNILGRLADGEVVERFSGGSRVEQPFLRPVRTAVAAYESWLHAPPDPAQVRDSLEQLLSRPPSEFDNRLYVERAVQQGNAEDRSDNVRTNVAAIRRLIGEIEQRGARALLIEVPFSPAIQDTQTARITRAIVRAAFPNPDRWLTLDPPPAELRWMDGVHLDERSALLVARSIETALAARGN